MSFLARLAARSRFPGAGISVAMPKGMVARRPMPLLRQPEEEQPEEETAAPMRRAVVRREEQPEKQEEEMQRAPAEEEPQEEEVAPMRRTARTLHRQAGNEQEEEDVAPLRRARSGEEPEEEVAPLRRQSQPEEEEELQTARIIRRAEDVPLEDGEKPLRQPFQSDLDPAAASPHPDLAGEEEPPAMQALRREVAAIPPAGPVAEAAYSHDAPYQDRFAGDRPSLPAPLPEFFTRDGGYDGFDTAGAYVPHATGSNERPEVIIEQLDVLIHEPAPPPRPASARADHGRSLRARYLRRL